MKIFSIAAVVLIFSANAYFQTCAETAAVKEPNLSEAAKKLYDTKLAEASAAFDQDPTDADRIIWFGRRTAYLGNYKKAIEIYSNGISKFPKDARFYRHRGHRYLSIRCFDDAIKDFEFAASLVKGKPDQIEPDGLPNAKNIPTSTLQSNIFYHLGLAYYVKGDFKKALGAYEKALKVSKNPDMLVATKHWEYMTLRRLGRKKAADRAVKSIAPDLEIIENDDYYKLIKLYQGIVKAETLVETVGEEANSLSNASLGYGLANWYFYNGDTKKAEKIWRQITAGDQWSSFGYIAAEADLAGR